jgi:hypothetical protein
VGPRASLGVLEKTKTAFCASQKWNPGLSSPQRLLKRLRRSPRRHDLSYTLRTSGLTLCNTVGGHFYLEWGGRVVIWNAANHLSSYTASRTRNSILYEELTIDSRLLRVHSNAVYTPVGPDLATVADSAFQNIDPAPHPRCEQWNMPLGSNADGEVSVALLQPPPPPHPCSDSFRRRYPWWVCEMPAYLCHC